MLLWIWIVPALLLSHAQAHNHQRALDTFYASEGHLVVLPCDRACQHNVSWSREGQGLQETVGVEVKGRQLWFQPAHISHSGVYTCHYWCLSGEAQSQMELSVTREKCPIVTENRTLHLGENRNIPCKLKHISKAYNHSIFKNARWMKGCTPLLRPGSSVDGQGQLWLQKLTPEDAGMYTCFIDVSVGGQNYSAARSVEVMLTNDSVLTVPHVVYPRDQEVQVHLGGSVELRCLADLGYSKDPFTHMFWLLNHSHTEEYPEVSESCNIVYERRRVQGVSTLIISEVHHGLLNMSIICRVRNAVGEDNGHIWLIQAEPSALASVLACSLSVCLALLLLTAVLTYCRVELVLAFRDLRNRYTRQHVADGKLYDGVVSCLYPPGLPPSELCLFSLQLLPQRLEQQWGYRLYIPGRDDCPGEAMHDALSETVRRSRRLLLLLCPSGGQGALSLSEELQPLCYEQRVGLHDALTHKEPRVILIEIGGPVNYSHLPQSVQYLRRTQGALQWKPTPRGRLGLLLNPEKSFWNRLHYHMPAVPSGRGEDQSLSPPTTLQFCHNPEVAHIELVETSATPENQSVQGINPFCLEC